MYSASNEPAGNCPTLERVWQDFQRVRNLKPNSRINYESSLRALGDWQSKPIKKITPAAVERKHLELTERGPAMANKVMRILRSLLNFARTKYCKRDGSPLLEGNPVDRLSALRAWNRINPRQTYIKPHQMRAWFKAVFELPNATARDFLILTLLCGLRRNEAARLTWDAVCLEERTITILDTKNHAPHVLPLSDFLLEMLTRRKQEANGSTFVFAGPDGTSHISEWNKSYQQVIHRSGIVFKMHCLRRTFCTVADSLGFPLHLIKRLMNHRQRGDVTMDYIVASVERIREPMQRISDAILGQAGIRPGMSISDLTRNDHSSHRFAELFKQAPAQLKGVLETDIVQRVGSYSEPVTARQIHSDVCSVRQITYSSVATTLARLAARGHLRVCGRVGCAFLYAKAEGQAC